MTRNLVIASVLVAAGCTGSGSPANPNLIDPGPVPVNGMQIILPVIKDIQPGTDNELCTWTDTIVDKDLWVKSVQGIQSAAGHHIVLYKTKTYQPGGTTRKCTDEDTATLRFVAGAGGEGVKEVNEAPGNLAFTIEKGNQIMINHHYINASPLPHDVQSAVNIVYTDPNDTSIIPSGALAVVDTNLHLAPGTPSIDINCTMQQSVKAWYWIPHMHAYGSEITIDHITPDGVSERLFDTPWTPEYTFHPPTMVTDPTTPKLLNKGDQVKVHCAWNNTTQSELTFGIEMCVFFAQTVDDQHVGNIACDAGQWTDF